MAEVIDTFLFALLLKAYVPEADLRCVFGDKGGGEEGYGRVHVYMYIHVRGA